MNIIDQRDNKRIIEIRHVETIYGTIYKPYIDPFYTRKLQFKFLWFWITEKKFTYRINWNNIIRAHCFGEIYDYSEDWEKVGLECIK